MQRILLLLVKLISSLLAFILVVSFFLPFTSFNPRQNSDPFWTCPSNEKQLGLGILEYAEDYDDCFPCGVDFDGDKRRHLHADKEFPQTHGWAGQIFPYVKTIRAFQCPSDNTVAPSGAYCLSYGMNWHLGYVGYQVRPEVGSGVTTISQLSNPKDTVMLAEERGDYTDVTKLGEVGSNTVTCKDPPYGGHGGIMATGRTPFSNYPVIPGGAAHGKGSYFLAADGHVQFLPPSRVSGGYYEQKSGYIQRDASTPTTTDEIENGRAGVVVLTFSPN